MFLPKLKKLDTSREVVDVFGGYNHNLRIGEGEFYGMENLSSDNYPVLSPRRKRGVIPDISGVQGITDKDGICWVSNGNFYFKGTKVEGLTLSATGKKTLVNIGACVVIFPDKKWVKIDPNESSVIRITYGDIEANQKFISQSKAFA